MKELNVIKNKHAPALQIGGATKDAVREVQAAVLAILNTAAGDDVKKAAIAAIGKVGSVDNTTFSNVSFS